LRGERNSGQQREEESSRQLPGHDNDYDVNHDDNSIENHNVSQSSAPVAAAAAADPQVGELSSSLSSSSASSSVDPMRFSLSFAAAHYGQKDAFREAISADKAHQDLKRRLEDVKNLGPGPPIIEAIIPERSLISSLFSKIDKGFQRFKIGIQRGATNTSTD